jgi:hypothetical protein
VIIEYDGERYLFDFDEITVKQAMKIEKHTGVKLTDWGDQLEKGDSMLALQALGWLVLFEGKGAVDDADFKLTAFGNAFGAALATTAEQQKAAEAAAPVPTGAVPVSNGQKPAADNQVLSPLSSVPASP